MNARSRFLLLAGKWCVAALLLFALSLPLTTCQTHRGLQKHEVTLSFDNAGTILCFAWPLPFLLGRLLIPAMRDSIKVVVCECVLAALAWCTLTVKVGLAAIASFGGITPGAGYALASSSLIGYFASSVIELAVSLGRRRSAVATGSAT